MSHTRGNSVPLELEDSLPLLILMTRMNQVMEKLKKMEEKDYTSLIRILFGLESPTPVAPKQDGSTETEVDKIEFIDPTLNDSQKDAIRFALSSTEIALIHGPPGVSGRLNIFDG